MAQQRNAPHVAHIVAWLAGMLVVVAACAKVAGIDELEIGDCKGGVCGSEGGADLDAPDPSGDTAPPGSDAGEGGVGPTLPCASLHGPTMVRVGTLANNFCIDSTEVSVSQYGEFTAAVGNDAGGQPTVCKWNTTYVAAFGGQPTIPIAGVDWCDARAYCAWAGKRLCGKQQGDKFVGTVGMADLGDFNTHEWLLACSDVGQLRYPYGGIQQPMSCNTAENDAGRSLPVGQKKTCQGGFAGVFDMVGNLSEWFDGPCLVTDAGADAGPAKDECYIKGGSFLERGVNIDCRVDGLGATRDRTGEEIGIRCCSD